MVEVSSAKYAKAMQKVVTKYDVTKIGERKVAGGMNFVSIEAEARLGRQLSGEADRMLRLVQDPVITEYVNRLGQNLVRNSDAKVPFTIKVVDSEEINAFALPGGYFYVNTGLILAADSEAELAAVMSHEIAHVAARHATKNLSKRELLQLCTLPTFFIAGPAVIAIREAAQIALPMTYMKFSRDAEREADLLGMEYAYASGYDPQAMVTFFQKALVRDQKRQRLIARAYATHPMTAERMQRAQAEIQTLLPPKDNYMLTTNEFDEIKARVSRLERNQLVAWAPSSKPTLRNRTDVESAPVSNTPTLRKTVGDGTNFTDVKKDVRTYAERQWN